MTRTASNCRARRFWLNKVKAANRPARRNNRPVAVSGDVMAVETLLPADERQRLVDQFAEIAALAGGLAHEIKNPLSTISLNLELLGEDVSAGESPRDRRMLKKIVAVQRECRRLEAILEDFLKFARVGELDLAPHDLNQVVRD